LEPFGADWHRLARIGTNWCLEAGSNAMTDQRTNITYVVGDEDETAGAMTSVTVADLGNNLSQVGAIYEQRGKATVKVVSLPSARSLYGASLKRALELRGGQLLAGDHVLGFAQDGGLVEEYVGDLALVGSASAARGSDTRYMDGWTARPLLAGLCAAHPARAARIDTTVYTIVPWNLWRQIGDQVVQSLTRTWKFSYNGGERTVRVRKAIVEGEGKIGYVGLVKERPALARGLYLGIDWGARTVCVAIYADGVFQGAAQIELGIDFLLDDVAFPRPLTPRELAGLKEALRDGKPYAIKHEFRDVRVDGLARAKFPAAVERLIQEINPTVRVDSADHVALYGGGAHFTTEPFRAQVPGVWVPREPERVNVRALLELARASA
jgi:hypothetical protein